MLEDKLLKLIALFEGSQNGRINVWDEQYLSVGTLHYAVRQHSGVRFLKRIQQLDPHGTRRCLGAGFASALKGRTPSVIAYCRRYVWRKSRAWATPFQRLSRLPAYAQADRECAKPYLDGARRIARRYNLTSERGLAFAFDRCVQQGTKARPHVDRVHAQVRGQTETQRMEALARAYADTANPKYRTVVLRRALTVARGGTYQTGYPGRFDLSRDYGISSSVPWDTPPLRVFLQYPQGNRHWDGKPRDYYGKPLSVAWLSGLKEKYRAGQKVMLSDRVQLEVYADGALQLRAI